MDHSYVRNFFKYLLIEEKASILAWTNSEKMPKYIHARFSSSKPIINPYVKWVRNEFIIFKITILAI